MYLFFVMPCKLEYAISKLFHSLLLLYLNISQSGYLSKIRIVFKKLNIPR